MEAIKIKHKGRFISLKAQSLGLFGRFRGLMFRIRSPNMLFNFKKEVNLSIHSLFVFFSFLAIWLDDKNNVLEYKIVRPFRLRIVSRRKYVKLLEVPLFEDNLRILNFFRRGRKV
jgi:hypothetical protein